MQIFVLCVYTVYEDANVLRRSQTVIEPCTEIESFFYIILSGLCVCVYESEKDICTYDS